MSQNQNRDISLDLGFDREALKKASGDAGLRFGFTEVDHEGNPVALADQLHRGDRLLLTLYDLTESFRAETAGSEIYDKYDEMSLKLTFLKAREQANVSPFSESVPSDAFDISRGWAVLSKSTVFNVEAPFWRAFAPQNTVEPHYPANQLRHGQQVGARTYGELIHKGYFYFTIELKVVWDAGTQHHFQFYRVDPEMVIDNDPGHDPTGREGSA